MKPLEVIRSATLETARFLQVADLLGTVESGKLADLILVDGDPSMSLEAMTRVRRVMLNGQWVTLPDEKR